MTKVVQHDLVYDGARYGHLVVAGPAFIIGRYARGKLRKEPHVVLNCDCGRFTTMPVHRLPSAKVCCGSSCPKKRPKPRGPRFEPLYQVWNGIIQRCENAKRKAYKNYGGRGIRMCDEWRNDFWSFQEWAIDNGWRKELEIDRYPNMNGDYEPGNCRFVTSKTNNRNRRNNVLITAFGESKTAPEWAEDSRCNVSSKTISDRIRAGWEPERAIARLRT